MSNRGNRPQHPAQPRQAVQTKPSVPAVPRVIAPPVVPPAPPTHAEQGAAPSEAKVFADLTSSKAWADATPEQRREMLAQHDARAAGDVPSDVPPTPEELKDMEAFDAEQRRQIEEGEKNQAIVDQEKVTDAPADSAATPPFPEKVPAKPLDTTRLPPAQQVGADRLEAEGRPMTDSLHVEDLGDVSDQVRAQDDALMEHALAEEAAGRADRVEGRRRKEVVLIHNTEGRVCGLPLPVLPGEKRAANTAPSITLMPGVTPVDRDEWDRALKQKMVRAHIEAGHFVQLEGSSISDLPEKKALELIDLVVHRPTLLDWADNEKRPRLRTALLSQLDKIAPTKPKKNRDEDDEDDRE